MKTPTITIAVDAMGGDHAPAVVVEGALDALLESGGRFAVSLVGRRDAIEAEVSTCRSAGKGVGNELLTIIHAPDVITMDDAPNAALRAKKASSISLGLELLKSGSAHGFVSAGNTGAVLSASTLILGRIEGVGRPTIGALIPTAVAPCLLLDAGANVDCKPRHLFEFGVMGSLYMSAMRGCARPRVALLNVGEEESKGNETTLEAFALLKQGPVHFIGNIEGRDVLKGKADVVVCDGFVGNILLKFGESIPSFFKSKFLAYAGTSIRTRLLAVAARSGLRTVMRELDYQEHGGVPLLGVNGVSIIGHGGSTAKAIKNMIYRAEEMIAKNVNGLITAELKRTHG